jgi:hypothetical protein
MRMYKFSTLIGEFSKVGKCMTLEKKQLSQEDPPYAWEFCHYREISY